LDEWELYNLPSNIMDSCFALLEGARYNYENKDDKNMAVTCTKLLHDCLVEQHRILTWLVELLVLKPFNEKFGAIIDELCGPLEDLIPDPVKEFLSPSDTIKEMASKAMASAIQAVITAGDQSTVPEKMASYFKDHGVVVDSSNLAHLQKQAQTQTIEEGSEGESKRAEPGELVRQPSKVPMEAVDSDSEPETGKPEHAAVAAPTTHTEYAAATTHTEHAAAANTEHAATTEYVATTHSEHAAAVTTGAEGEHVAVSTSA